MPIYQKEGQSKASQGHYMAKTKTNTKEELIAQVKLREYEREQRQRFVFNILGYSGLAVIAVLLIMVVSGERFESILSVFGLKSLYNEERGVYADCSRRENANNKFCNGG